VAPSRPARYVTPLPRDARSVAPVITAVSPGATLPISVESASAPQPAPREFFGIAADVAPLALAGTPSLIWFATDGTATIWKMFGPTWSGGGAVVLSIPAPWRLATAGDLNGDGNPDFIWEATTDGTRAVTFMNGAAYGGSYAMMFVFSPDWKIVGTGDFNGDAKTDIVVTNTVTNAHGVLLLNGTTFLSFQFLPNYGPDWRPVAVADMNGDSKPDLVYFNATQPWFITSLLNGTGVLSGSVSYIWSLAANWRIGAAADFNADGKGDLVIQNTSDGQRQIEFMDYDPTYFMMPTGEYSALPTVNVVNNVVATALIKYNVAALNLKLNNYYVTQGIQDVARSVPLVAGRPALVRAFVSANDYNTAAPVVRVRITPLSGPFTDFVVTRPTDPPVPVIVSEGTLGSTYNAAIPGSLITAGATISVTVDPNNLIAETDESDNAMAGGLVVRTMPQFDVRFVPVRLTTGETGDVSLANIPTYMNMSMKIWPFVSYSADIHAVFTSSQSTITTPDAWNTIIGEILNLRVVEGNPRYYFGELPPLSGSPYGGLGYIGYPTAIGLGVTSVTDTTRSELNAHEWGHNFNRPHSPGCGAAGPDPGYPVPSGHTDAYGYNPSAGTAPQPTGYYDIMSYCGPKWIAAYTVKSMMNYVAPSASPALLAAPTSTLIVWGRVRPDGSVVLEPSFEVTTVPRLPEGHGQFAIEGRDDSNALVFSGSFEGLEVADGAPGERHFSFAVPLSRENIARLKKIQVLRGGRAVAVNTEPAETSAVASEPNESVVSVAGGVQLRWNPGAYRMVMVRDAATGEVISFARGGSARISSRSNHAVNLIFSDGVHSTSRIVTPQ